MSMDLVFNLWLNHFLSGNKKFWKFPLPGRSRCGCRHRRPGRARSRTRWDVFGPSFSNPTRQGVESRSRVSRWSRAGLAAPLFVEKNMKQNFFNYKDLNLGRLWCKLFLKQSHRPFGRGAQQLMGDEGLDLPNSKVLCLWNYKKECMVNEGQ